VRPGEIVYPTPMPEFRLSRISLSAQPLGLDHDGPQVVLVVDGSATVTDGDGREISVARGHSVWIAAADVGVTISGSGMAFRATDGLVTP
jgi:mannose-6-phosphate isomerase